MYNSPLKHACLISNHLVFKQIMSMPVNKYNAGGNLCNNTMICKFYSTETINDKLLYLSSRKQAGIAQGNRSSFKFVVLFIHMGELYMEYTFYIISGM